MIKEMISVPNRFLITICCFLSSDVVTKEEAIEILKSKEIGKAQREEEMRTKGYPAYTTQVGE